MYELKKKKLERYLRVYLLGLGPRLMKKNLPGRGLTMVEKRYSKPYLLKICFNLCSHPCLKSHIFPHKNPTGTSPFPSTCHMPHPSHYFWYDHPNDVCLGVTIHGDLCNVIPPVFCFPIILKTKYPTTSYVLHFYSKELLPSQTKRICLQKELTVTLKQTEVAVDSKHTYNGNHL